MANGMTVKQTVSVSKVSCRNAAGKILHKTVQRNQPEPTGYEYAVPPPGTVGEN